MKRSYKYIMMLAVAAAFTACSDDEPYVNPDGSETLEDGTLLTDHAAFNIGLEGMYNTNPQAARSAIMSTEHKYWDDKESGFMLSATYVEPDKTPLASRAEHLDSGYTWKFDEWYKDVGVMVSAYYDKDGEQEWLRDIPFRRNGDGAWRPDQRRYWPRGASKFTLYAWTPLRQEYYDRDTRDFGGDADQSKRVGFGSWYDGTTPYLWYRTAIYSADQQDIMVAKRELWPSGNGNGSALQVDGDPVAAKQMTFTHALGGLRFRIARRPGRPNINRFDLCQIPYRTGDYNMRTGEWVNKRDRFNSWTAWTDDKSTPGRKNWTDFWVQQHTYNDVMPEDRTFMLIPQKFDSDTYLRIFWADGTSTDVNLNGVEIQAGRMLYIDIQEPSIFVEGMKSFRENSDDSWTYPTPNGGFDYLRLWESPSGNYYQSNRPVSFGNWRLPYSVDEDNQVWNDNNGEYFGHRLAFNVLSRCYKDGKIDGDGNIFYHGRNMLQDFFIMKKEVTYDYKEYHNGNTTRESRFRDYNNRPWPDDIAKSAAPELWHEKGGFLASNCAPWYFMGGELYLKIVPKRENWGYPDWGGSGQITFTPVSTPDHPINFPPRICVAGSVNRYPYLIVEPFENGGDRSGWQFTGRDNRGFDKDDLDRCYKNLRSYREHCLWRISDDGVYEGYICVNQRTPSMGTRVDGYGRTDGLYCIPNGWYDSDYLCLNGYWTYNKKSRGYGVVMFYTSTLHGSYGHNEHPADEYESRLGVALPLDDNGNIQVNGGGGIYYDNSGGSEEGWIGNIAHTYSGSYFKLKCGWYYVKIDLVNKSLYYKRTGDIMDSGYDKVAGCTWENDWQWKAFKFPHHQLRYIWYDVYKWNFSGWYTRLTYNFGWGINAGFYYYDHYPDGNNAPYWD